MAIATVQSSLQEIIKTYLSELERIDDGLFNISPPIGGWSPSQVYSHIWEASYLTLLTMEDCIEGRGKIKPTAFTVKLILFFGALPPGKYKAPDMLKGLDKNISKAEARQLIAKFKRRMERDYIKLESASPEIKTKHPNMGYLNATQWFRFLEIHLKHHLKQLKHIKRSFTQLASD
ncbi:DinB family protein [Pedobacter sp. MC2016-14]|uniref:DinB family protein n=1 Tax=Pedobacter sp. MC2016-14 TaxID=2897327 RepID=UPI001E473374|nr:DinB family protein [Pedobacter sp. MC2016-14]MCD0487549.1 DinB family protein [Pedobacter sp. MC2016-14]